MSAILVYIEHLPDQTNSKLSKAALATIAAAAELKRVQGSSRLIGILIGDSGVEEAAKEAAFYGLDEIHFAKHSALESYLALNYEQVFSALASALGPRTVVGCANSRGKDLFPRIACALDAGQASDVLAILENGGFRRPMYAGNVLADVEITTETKVVTIRPTAFAPAAKGASACSVQEFPLADFSPTSAQQYLRFETVASERPELTEAEIVVSGGRAMKSTENFDKYIAPLADVLGAAIGASRAAVDAGYAPNDWQVGQTGKVVAPALYIAVGISGAIQHLAGMKDAKTIVAINTDPEAPIFEVADYGLVADLYQAVPELTEALRAAKAQQ